MNFANYLDRAFRDSPDRIAITDPARSLTYDELRDETNSFASGLAEMGVEAGDCVGILLPNIVTFATTYFGTMRRGAVPLPINLRFDPETIGYVLEDADVEVIVTVDQFAELVENAHADSLEHLIIDGESDHGTHEYSNLVADADPEFDVHPRMDTELAHLVYTSGTTGRPKGVRHTHQNLRANTEGFIRYMQWSEHDVALTVCPCFHVAGLNVGLNPFIALGAENHFLPQWDPEQALQVIEEESVTYVGYISTMLHDVLSHDRVDDYDTSSLEAVIVGGAPVPSEQITEAEQTFGCPLIETWGMTESTPLAAINRPDRERKAGSIGKVAREVAEIRIENPETGDLVDVGENGELLIRGDTVMDGYLNLPEKTQEAFVVREGEQWLRSGDIGYRDADGFLFLEDRIDHMIITGGENVYPSRVEEAVYECDGVNEVAVIGTPDDRFGEIITAVVVAESEELTATDIKQACRDMGLADYQVPKRIEFVDELPKTATQKIDKMAVEDSFT